MTTIATNALVEEIAITNASARNHLNRSVLAHAQSLAD